MAGLELPRQQYGGVRAAEPKLQMEPAIMVQSQAKVLAKRYVPQNHRDELLLPITPPPINKNTCRELFLVEKAVVIALFWFVREISIVSLITGRPWSTVRKRTAGYLADY